MNAVIEVVRRNGIQTLVLAVAAVLLLLPLVGAAMFGFRMPDGSFTLMHVSEAVSGRAFSRQLVLTSGLAVATIIGLFVLLIPTLLVLHLRLRALLPVAEGFSVLPYVVPAVALVGGANLTFRPLWPTFLASSHSLVPFYVILAMPLVYRTLDAGLRAMDLRVLVDASRSLGASWVRTVLTVVLPNLRTALLTGALLAVTLVLGEFALAQLLLQETFPVFLNDLGRNAPRGAAGMAFIVIVGTWLLLSLFTGPSRRRSPLTAAIAAGPDASAKGSS